MGYLAKMLGRFYLDHDDHNTLCLAMRLDTHENHSRPHQNYNPKIFLSYKFAKIPNNNLIVYEHDLIKKQNHGIKQLINKIVL